MGDPFVENIGTKEVKVTQRSLFVRENENSD